MSQYRTAHSHPLPLSSRADVAVLVGFPIKQLNYWTRVLPPERRYTVFSIPRRNGNNARVIHAPIKPIKDMQLKLAAALVPCYHPRAAVQGYVRARSILSNAKIHSRKRWVLHIDIEDFFPSINFGRVRGMFMAYPFNYTPEVATLLAQICCHANALPHGAPTSPVISNLICRGLDKDFLALASRQHCHYSRYCDDIVFSATRKPSPGALFMQDDKGLLVAGSEVTEIISNHGFRLNAEKTHLRPRTQRQMVTGLVVNRKPNVPREYIRGLRNLLYIWRKYSQEHAQARFAATQHARYRPARKPIPPLSFQWMIRGRVQYVGQIKGWTDPVYLGLAKALAFVDHGFKEPRIVRTGQTAKLALYVEGPTDALHLQAALAFFRQKGQYENLNLNFQHVSGDQQLLKHARNSSSIEHDLPIVCLFDRDKPAILKDVLGTEDEVKDWGHEVFSSAIPVPAYRKSEEPICVEMLYPDEILHLEDAEGRRLYLKSEFNQESGYHLTEEVHYIHPKRESLVAEDVYRGHQKASLSKTQFAEMVKARVAPFKLISFEGFKEIFDMLTRIYENWQSSRQRAG